jgi:hypothetical protein
MKKSEKNEKITHKKSEKYSRSRMKKARKEKFTL